MLSVQRVAQAAGFIHVDTFESAFTSAFGEVPDATRRRGISKQAALRELDLQEQGALAVRLASLSSREHDICALIARGMLNKQIAVELAITERTVREHRGRAIKKLGIRSVVELARLFATSVE